MKLLTNICLPSATFPPSAHVCGVLLSSTKKVHTPSKGVALGAALLKILVEVLRGGRRLQFAIQHKVLCERTIYILKHLLRT